MDLFRGRGHGPEEGLGNRQELDTRRTAQDGAGFQAKPDGLKLLPGALSRRMPERKSNAEESVTPEAGHFLEQEREKRQWLLLYRAAVIKSF